MEAQLPKIGRAREVVAEGIIIVDPDFKVIALNEAAQATLSCFNSNHDGSGHALSLPEEILKVLKARRKDGPDPIVFSANARNGEYNCRAFTLNGGDIGSAAPMLTLYIKREVSVNDAVRQVGLYYNLTQREQEALMGISLGLTSKQLAKRMKISPNTVKAFLRLIMIKMGAATRAGVVGKLLEQDSPSLKAIHLEREI